MHYLKITIFSSLVGSTPIINPCTNGVWISVVFELLISKCGKCHTCPILPVGCTSIVQIFLRELVEFGISIKLLGIVVEFDLVPKWDVPLVDTGNLGQYLHVSTRMTDFVLNSYPGIVKPRLDWKLVALIPFVNTVKT